MNIVTIDTGTTNTRTKLWQGGEMLASSHVSVGVRDTSISGSRKKLKMAVREAIELVLGKSGLTHLDIELFVASGMITSNVGLLEIPHAVAPAGIPELAHEMVSETIPEIMDRPIWFVPGVKNNVPQVTVDNCESMDVMRGEEVETFGLLEYLNLNGPALLILPGSHSKFVRVGEDRRIQGCVTTLAGELLSVLTTNTILADSLEKSFARSIDPEMVLKGADYALRFGITRTCFAVRILDQFTGSSVSGRANFLAGAMAATDLLAIKNSGALGDCRKLSVIIGGSNIMAGVFEVLVRNDNYFRGEPIAVDSKVMKDISGLGAISVARERGLCD